MGIKEVTHTRSETNARVETWQYEVMVNSGRAIGKMGLGENRRFGTSVRRATTHVFVSTAGRNTDAKTFGKFVQVGVNHPLLLWSWFPFGDILADRFVDLFGIFIPPVAMVGRWPTKARRKVVLPSSLSSITTMGNALRYDFQTTVMDSYILAKSARDIEQKAVHCWI
jgi:hypothetical protein